MSTITTEDAIKAAIAVLQEETGIDHLLSILKQLDSSDIRYERLRLEISNAKSERVFNALRRTIVKQPPISPVRPTRVQATENKRLQSWMNLFISDNGTEEKGSPAAAADGKVVQQPAPIKQTNVINKTTIDLITYGGERGEATVWWEDVKQELENAYPGANRRTRNQWLPLIRKALKSYKTGITRINEYFQSMKGPDQLVNVDALMIRFCESMDTNSLPILLAKYGSMRQKEKESAVDFATNFKKLTRSLQRQGHDLPENIKMNDFKSRLRLYSKVLLDCDENTIDAVAQWCAKREDMQQNLKKRSPIGNVNDDDTLQKLKGLLTNIKDDRRKKKVKTFTSRDGITRCGRCCRDMKRVAKQHADGCPYPKSTLQKQLRWEKDRKPKKESKMDKAKKLLKSLNNLEEVDLDTLAGLMAVAPADEGSKPKDLLNNSEAASTFHQRHEKPMKVSMIKFAVSNNGGEMVKLPALVDTGALPSSYISLKTISRLGLQDSIQVQPQDYRLADGKGHLKTLLGHNQAEIFHKWH